MEVKINLPLSQTPLPPPSLQAARTRAAPQGQKKAERIKKREGGRATTKVRVICRAPAGVLHSLIPPPRKSIRSCRLVCTLSLSLTSLSLDDNDDDDFVSLSLSLSLFSFSLALAL